MADNSHAARRARLRYVSDAEAGITRRAAGGGFVYLDPGGRPVRAAATLDRIRSLAIPPAWTDVWICPRSDGHIQATGRDARGRKQYRYHPRWSLVRDAEKYGRILEFARALPRIRRQLARDLRRAPLSRRRVLATVVHLLQATLIRVGNDEYVRANGSYGLTTLEDRHVTIDGPRLRFRFRAKSGVVQNIDLEDARLAESVRRSRDLPGQRLFQYVDAEGRRPWIESTDVNAYLREISGRDFTAKDFRTWSATVLAACALRGCATETTARGRKRAVVQAIDHVASRLGNTRAVCRKAYIHPAVLEEFMSGTTIQALATGAAGAESRSATDLSPDERAVLAFLSSLSRRAARAVRGAENRRAGTGPMLLP